MSQLPTRDEAWNILTKYVTTDHLQRHVLMVEGAMRHFARLYNEDEEAWGILGMLHDIDFELYPNEHLDHAPQILREEIADLPEEIEDRAAGVPFFGGRTRKVGILLGEGKTYREALDILAGVTLESLVVSRRVYAAMEKKAERGLVDLKKFPMLCHAAAVLDKGADAELPWEAFTFDETK